MKTRTQKEKENLLRDCLINSRRLEDQLFILLKAYGVGFIQLLKELGTKLNILDPDDLCLPIKLSGTTNNLVVEDKNGSCISLQLYKSYIIFKQYDPEYESYYLINRETDSIEEITVSYASENIRFSIGSIIELTGNNSDAITIILNDNDEFPEIIDKLSELCVETLNKYLKTGIFDISKIEELLVSSGHEDYTILRKNKQRPAS